MTHIVHNDNESVAALEPSLDAPMHHVPEVHELLMAAIEIVETARPMPLSTSLMINGEPLIDLLHDAIARLPEELRAARWLLRERDEYLEGVRREGEEITQIARSRAEHMVERTEVVKSAEQRAQRILADAESESRLMMRETEDFCDARLAALEGILDRTRTVVATGRTRLQGTAQIDLTDAAIEPEPIVERTELFDQDFS
jgi:dsDNA-specific endonuclease/ATPase MutS2